MESWWSNLNYWMNQSSSNWQGIGQVIDWNPVIIGLFILTGSIMALSFFSIAGLVIYSSSKRGFFNWAQRMTTYFFLSFLFLCGSLFLLREVTIFYPLFWLYGGVKIVTSIAAIMTVVLYIRYIPILMKVPSKLQWDTLKAERNDAINKNKLLTNHLSTWSDNLGKHIRVLKEQHHILAEDLAERGLPVTTVSDVKDVGKEKALESLDRIQKELELLTSNIEDS